MIPPPKNVYFKSMHRLLIEFQDKLSNILFEDRKVSSSDVTDAIENQYRVQINYDDETEDPKTGTRLIEPYVYGLSLGGNEVIRAFQYGGSTKRGVPKYKLFRLDRITSWTPLTKSHFVAEPKKLAATNIDYNNNGDKKMTMIFAQVKFNGEDNTPSTETEATPEMWQSPLDKIKKDRENIKQNLEKQLSNKKQQIFTKPKDENNNNFEQDIDKSLGLTSTDKPLDISSQKYDNDSKSQEEKHDNEISRRRDQRWEKSVEERPLHRKGSFNADLQK